MKAVSYTRRAIKDLRGIPTKDREAIMTKMDLYAANGIGDVVALQESDLFRLRHGNWRAVFDQNGTVITVITVAKRGEVYR